MEYKGGVDDHLITETDKVAFTFNLNLGLVKGILGSPEVWKYVGY